MKIAKRILQFATLYLLAVSLPANTTLGQANETKPLKVFVLAGQSNMQGHAKISTLAHLGMSDATQPILSDLQNENGTPKVHDDVWISYLSSGGTKTGQLTTGFGADESKIGPELTFGLYMQKALDEPILLIKTAWGGKSINTDFRPPSAGLFVFRDEQIQQFKDQDKNVDEIQQQKVDATGHYYRLMIEHVRSVLGDIQTVYPDYDKDAGFELAGFVWFQGWNDMVDRGVYPNRDQKGGYDQYSEVLMHFIRDVRKDLDCPALPFVIGVMGAGGPTSKYKEGQVRYQAIHQNFRDAMAAPSLLDEFKSSVFAFQTENCWDFELTELRRREQKLKQELKLLKEKTTLTREGEQKAWNEIREKAFNERERQVLEVGISNQEYHYLGSGKIMALIGKGFAETLINAR